MSKKLDRNSGGIEITGHKGTWYVIDEGDYKITQDVDGKPETLTAHLFLLESELYGDEAACLIVNEDSWISMPQPGRRRTSPWPAWSGPSWS